MLSGPSYQHTHTRLCLLGFESSSSSPSSALFSSLMAATFVLPHTILPLLSVLAGSLDDGDEVGAELDGWMKGPIAALH